MAYTAYESMTIEEIVRKVEHAYDEEAAALVQRAYQFAEKAHANQKRKSGEPYIVHPLYVGSILAKIMLDPPTIAACFLHDTVEDCQSVSLASIQAEFGEEVARLVDGVTKLEQIEFSDREEKQAESIRKMIFAMSKDIRVVLVKLADRLHNMLTLNYKTPERQIAIARETLDIYAPLAHRLGVYSIKQELEDLSLRYIDPMGYLEVARKVGLKRKEREESIHIIIDEITEGLQNANIPFTVDGRPKHLYSIYNKMIFQDKTFDQIYDLIAVRIIVDTIPDCYAALGIVHNLWSPIPKRFKDYISTPKVNRYQSLHTTVMGKRRIAFPFEIQIRTHEMHQFAEFGIAAHWNYKEHGKDKKMDEKLFWLRSILDWQNETRDSLEFINGLKTDLFAGELFLFTPKGEVINMQAGSTPIDFAYRIHSQVGNQCVGAKVDGKMVTLNSTLSTGNRVEILTSSSSKGPSMDWINIVKTQQAKAKIRQFFKKELRGDNIIKGKSMLDHEAKRKGVKLADYMKPEYYRPLLERYMFQEVDDLYGAVGYGGITALYTISRLIEEKRSIEAKKAPPVIAPSAFPEIPPQTRRNQKSTNGVYVEGEADILVHYGNCCKPLPGDDIVGYITRNRGVTVHKADCVHALNGEQERFVGVTWADKNEEKFDTKVQFVCYDHKNLLSEVIVQINELRTPITSVRVILNKNKTCSIFLTVKVEGKEQLDLLLKTIQKRSDVIDAYRI